MKNKTNTLVFETDLTSDKDLTNSSSKFYIKLYENNKISIEFGYSYTYKDDIALYIAKCLNTFNKSFDLIEYGSNTNSSKLPTKFLIKKYLRAGLVLDIHKENNPKTQLSIK